MTPTLIVYLALSVTLFFGLYVGRHIGYEAGVRDERIRQQLASLDRRHP